MNISHIEHNERPVYTSSARPEQMSSERQLTSTYRDLVDILREQLQAGHAREQAYQEHIERLTLMLHEAQQRSDRLLEAPRTVTLSAAPPALRDPTTAAVPQGDRGEMRRRILALLHDYPDGLTPAEMQRYLQVEKRLADTVLAMARDGLVRKVGPGRYTTA